MKLQEANDVDRLIAQKLSKMSIQDREKVEHDVHGISVGFEETPEFIHESLLKLEQELEKLKETERKDYDLAKSIDRHYVQNTKFRIKFLRADRYHAKNAARRIARHFKAKIELFGIEKAVKDIVQDDLTPEDMAVLNYGAPSILPLRDRSGRVVCLWIPRPQIQEMACLPKLRASFYVAQVLSEDEETQKKGCVCVLYLVGNKGKIRDTEAEWKLVSLSRAIPIRSEAQYFCYDNWHILPMVTVIKYGCSAFNIVRFRSQFGKQSDIMFWLQTFGIPTKLIPLSEDGNIIFDQNISMWEKRRCLEQTTTTTSSSPSSVSPSPIPSPSPSLITVETTTSSTTTTQNATAAITGTGKVKSTTTTTTTSSATKTKTTTTTANHVGVPGRFDVLLGRGKACHDHPGNVRLRHLVEEWADIYSCSCKKQKTRVTREILEMISNSSGRFLKESDSGWIEVSQEVARLKVSHVFRDMPRFSSSSSSSTTGRRRSTVTTAQKRNRNNTTTATTGVGFGSNVGFVGSDATATASRRAVKRKAVKREKL